MAHNPNIHKISAKRFINRCKSKFGWSSFAKDVVMDVGCGEEGFCGKTILELFPDVRAVIFMDKKSEVVSKLKSSFKPDMNYAVADIENRQSIRDYEGRMTKVVSTHVFHQLTDKEEAIRNVYHILKPGGEAALLFIVKSLIYEWLTEMLKIPRWKAVYKGHYVEDLYKGQLATVHYKEMAEKIGFRVVDCSEELRVVPADSDDICKDGMYKMCGEAFIIAPELLQEFKDESFQVVTKLSERDAQGRPCFRSTELSLLLVKPA